MTGLHAVEDPTRLVEVLADADLGGVEPMLVSKSLESAGEVAGALRTADWEILDGLVDSAAADVAAELRVGANANEHAVPLRKALDQAKRRLVALFRSTPPNPPLPGPDSSAASPRPVRVRPRAGSVTSSANCGSSARSTRRDHRGDVPRRGGRMTTTDLDSAIENAVVSRVTDIVEKLDAARGGVAGRVVIVCARDGTGVARTGRRRSARAPVRYVACPSVLSAVRAGPAAGGRLRLRGAGRSPTATRANWATP
ncbi:hypothetical protein K7G98_17000 [Saccharothrix sp. MB29]|nr:hypothetical protein [Saccharothrix sp. MB29]